MNEEEREGEIKMIPCIDNDISLHYEVDHCIDLSPFCTCLARGTFKILQLEQRVYSILHLLCDEHGTLQMKSNSCINQTRSGGSNILYSSLPLLLKGLYTDNLGSKSTTGANLGQFSDEIKLHEGYKNRKLCQYR